MIQVNRIYLIFNRLVTKKFLVDTSATITKTENIMEKSLIHSNELHFISKKRIHQAVEKMVESLDLAAGSTTGFNIYAVVESYFTDLEKRKEINQLLNLEQDVCEEIEAELSYK